MPREITSATSLDNLRKEAKRWLKALRDNDAEARERLQSAYPNASATPVLRDVQYALAREYGFHNWKELRLAVEKRVASIAPDSSLIARFLECACPDHHVRGLPAHRMARHAAGRILEQNPSIPRANIYTAVVCGEIQEVERILRDRPDLADTKHAASGPDRSGPGGQFDFLGDLGGKAWEPLLYLCFTRLPLPKASENAVAIAKLLLDRGADPNAFFMAGNSRYTPLVGVIGEGEENRPPHPRRDELVHLLLERGAEPYDGQVIYNIHFHGKILWWLELMYEFSVKAGRQADWDDPEWHMLDQGAYGSGAQWHLRIAAEKNDTELAEWCVAHGARPEAAPPQIVPNDDEQFVAACLRLDRVATGETLARHPEFLQSPKAMFAAARQDRADAVSLLLELGTPVEVEDDKKQRTLHVAAANDAVHVAGLLIERGAEVDPYERNYDNTPLDFAVYHEHARMIELLRRHSRDVWNLVFIGDVERLREIIPAEPRLAKVSWQTTPLFWLPEDEEKALEIVRLFLDHGADATFRSKKDLSTAADVARNRGMAQVAALLDSSGSAPNADLRSLYEQLASDLVTVYTSDDEQALERLGRHYNRLVSFAHVRNMLRQRIERLREATDASLEIEEAREIVARQAGFESWAVFLQSTAAAALARLNAHYGRDFTFEDLGAEVWRRVYAYRQRAFQGPKNYLQLAEAQVVIAQDAGFGSWAALMKAVAAGTPPGEPYAIDAKENRAGPRRRMTAAEWDELIAVMQERRVTSLEANGLMTDEVMARVAALDHVTHLSLGGSRELSDDGLLQLARMPQLEYLNLSEYPGGKLTDRGLEVLRHLPNLRTFEMTWQAGISDRGVANLKLCEHLEHVDLMGSPTGDGAIEALQGKPKLSYFSTGRLVTDAGLPLLHNFPLLKKWEGEPDQGPHLLIDGPFTDAGLARLAGLEGVFELDLFWHVTAITPAGFVHLVELRNLSSLGCDGKLSDDTAMGHIAAMPRLRRLRAQESTATDDGFVSLSRSKSLEFFWGRECPNFGSRGFVAFSKMPTLRGLGVSCRNVDDAALSTLPDFPALRQLTPVGMQDDGFRHVGKCLRLERLTCMYCRDTTDVATEHIAGLTIKYYYAGLTQITDRSLEILGRMPSLEQIELYECKGVTDAGLKFLTGLPRLREVSFGGSPGLTLAGAKVFPAQVRVQYST